MLNLLDSYEYHVGLCGESDVKKSCEYGEHGSFEHLLFLFIHIFINSCTFMIRGNCFCEHCCGM